jgi:hypothetical protein
MVVLASPKMEEVSLKSWNRDIFPAFVIFSFSYLMVGLLATKQSSTIAESLVNDSEVGICF